MAASRLASRVPGPVASLLLVALTATCAHRDITCDRGATPSPPAASSSVPVPIASSVNVAPVAAPEPDRASWVDAVRLEDWDRAAALLAALDSEQQACPEIRYVRARVALARNQFPEAAALLQGLEAQLPELAADVAFHRAEAQLHAGPVEEAATFFAARSGVEELVKAALAFQQVGDAKRARDAIDRAIRAARNSHNEHAVQAREVRARLAEAAGQTDVAVSDLRFVARYAPFADQAEDAVEAVRRLDPSQVPSASERMARAARLAERGDPEQALDELGRVAAAPGKTPTRGQLTMARARAVYGTRERYGEAAELFEQAAKIDAAAAPEALYFAAKAWSRADRNDRGLELYARVADKFPRTAWAERASYQRARLLRLESRWRDAATAYASYLARFRRGPSVREARYEHALCLLLSGNPKGARSRLEQLAGQEDNRTDAAALRELVGVAALAAGDAKAAAEIWRSVIDREPLSFAALLSASRLRAVGQGQPPPIHPGPDAGREPLVVALPRTARLLHELGLEADAEDWLADNEDGIALGFGPRAAEARCALYGNLDRARRLYRVGQRHAPVELVMSSPSSSTRWAWSCLFPRPYAEEVAETERRESIPRGLIHAVMRQESGFNPDARSPVGALGLMQLMPSTARKTAARFKLEGLDNRLAAPAANLRLGAAYLALLLRTFDGSVPLSVAAYNAGPKAVGAWLSHAAQMDLDVFVAQIPYRETRRYVWRVVGNYARYEHLAGGLDGIPAVELVLPSGVSIPDDIY